MAADEGFPGGVDEPEPESLLERRLEVADPLELASALGGAESGGRPCVDRGGRVRPVRSVAWVSPLMRGRWWWGRARGRASGRRSTCSYAAPAPPRPAPWGGARSRAPGGSWGPACPRG